MAERRISIESLTKASQNTHYSVVVWEKQIVEGQEQEIPIGEKQFALSNSLTKQQVIVEVRKVGKEIETLADQAKIERVELNKVLAKGVVE